MFSGGVLKAWVLQGRICLAGVCKDQTCGQDSFSKGPFQDKSFGEDVLSGSACKDESCREDAFSGGACLQGSDMRGGFV